MPSDVQLVFEENIRASAERVFGLLADLRNYDRWLPPSSAFHGTTEISDGPIGVGTTYVETGPSGVRRGRVTDFDPPTRIGFEQPMTMKPRGAGVVNIDLVHMLTPTTDGVRLVRTVSLSLTGPIRVVRPLVRRSIVAENTRMIAAIRAYAESPSTA
jgi:uncharacterized protein YndB with AHSA1/START domain